MTEIVDLLTRLSSAPGVSGFEDPIISIVADELRPYVDKVEVDQLGNVLTTKRGTNDNAPKIMVDAHIDEPAIVVKYVEDSGFLRLERQGFPHLAALSAQKVVIHTRKGPVKGVVGVKGIHLYFIEMGAPKKPAEVPNLRDFYIDVGCNGREEVQELGIRVGDPITYDAEVGMLGAGKFIVGKAFDNRALVAVMIEAMKGLFDTDHEATIYAVGSTMEELGLRGARGAMARLKPDMFISLDITVTADTPDAELRDFPTRLGKGPVITIADMLWDFVMGMTAHPRIRDHFIQTAESEGIPYQVEAITGAVANASIAHEVGTGIPAGELKIPTRYSHSPSEVINIDDLDNCVKLLIAGLKNIRADFSLSRPYKPS